MRNFWLMTQEWHDVFFLHWPVKAEWLRPFVPAELELDTVDGQAWLGVVGFRAAHTRPRFLPPVPGTSTFLELNVRTYVKCNERSGVYFFSLDASSPLAVAAASAGGFLPYRHAKMHRQEKSGKQLFRSRLKQPGEFPETLDLSYRISADPILSTPFEQWLTERYSLWTKPKKQLLRLDIDHAPWRLHRMSGEIRKNTMAVFQPKNLHQEQPVAHYARYQKVRFYPPIREEKA